MVAALIALVAVLGVAAATILIAGRGTTFFFDEWLWIAHRRNPSASSLLEPFNNHWMAVPVLTYQAMFRIFGLGSYVPYRIVLATLHLATCALLYVYLRRRVGSVAALLGAAALAFFGYAWAVVIWPISFGWVYATTFGIAAMLLVDRNRRGSDWMAGGLLLLGVASSGVGVPFAIGLAIEFAVARAWRRLAVPGVAVVVFGVWYFAYDRHSKLAFGDATTHRTAGEILKLADAVLAQTAGSLFGSGDRGVPAHLALLAVVGALAIAWWMLGKPRSPRLVGSATALISFVAMVSYSRAGKGAVSWYSYAAAVFLLLLVGELFRGRVRITPWVLAVGLLLVTWSIVWNVGQLADGADLQRERSREVLGALAAERIAGDAMPDDASLGGFLLGVTAGEYREAQQRYGSPAYTRTELADAPRRVRTAADRTLVAALGLDVADAPPGGECRALSQGRNEIDGAALAVVIDARDAPVRVRLGVAGRGARLRPVEAGTRGLVRAPDLGHGARWVLRLGVEGSALICSAADGQP